MHYLLDICALSEFLKRQSNEKVLSWIAAHDEETYVSVLAIGEIQKGIAKLDASKGRGELEGWLEAVNERYGTRILAFEKGTASLWGKMKAGLEKEGCVLPVIDSLMAATALEHDLTLVTRNETDFIPTGAKVLNLWN